MRRNGRRRSLTKDKNRPEPEGSFWWDTKDKNQWEKKRERERGCGRKRGVKNRKRRATKKKLSRTQPGWKSNWSFNCQINWLEFLSPRSLSAVSTIFPPDLAFTRQFRWDKVATACINHGGKPGEFPPALRYLCACKNETPVTLPRPADCNYTNVITFRLRFNGFLCNFN